MTLLQTNEILSNQTFKLFTTGTKVMYYFGVAPYKWNKTTKTEIYKLSLCDYSIFYRIYTILGFIAVVFHIVFLYEQLIMALHNGLPIQLVMQLLWNSVCYSSPVVAQIEIYRCWNEIPIFINGFMDYFSRVQSTYSFNLLFHTLDDVLTVLIQF